ncbi:rhamnogalacturonan acetylesterase [Salana multivorans]|nr:rhamnogalacturonan acetylesterase [Salana multivorans]
MSTSTPATTRTIHLAGDSTVAPGPLDDTGVAGWGAALHEYVDLPVANRAIGGATTASFVADGRWRATLDAIEPGDLVLIQFGHNDQKEESLDAEGGYRANLARFVAQVGDRGGRPVLLTSVERCLFTDAGELRVSHGPYPRAVRRLARDADVPLIDLTVFTRWLYQHLGPAGSERLFGHRNPDDGSPDHTHFGAAGARTVAAYVAQEFRAILGLDDDVAPLGSWTHRP